MAIILVKKDKITVMDPFMAKCIYTLSGVFRTWTGVLIFLEPERIFEQKDENKPYKKILNLVQPHKVYYKFY